MITSFITLRGPISYRGSGAAAIRTSGWLSFHLFLGDAQLILQPFQLAFSVHLAIFRKVFVMQVTGVDEREIGNPLVAEKLIRSSNQKQSSKKKILSCLWMVCFFLGGLVWETLRNRMFQVSKCFDIHSREVTERDGLGMSGSWILGDYFKEHVKYEYRHWEFETRYVPKWYFIPRDIKHMYIHMGFKGPSFIPFHSSDQILFDPENQTWQGIKGKFKQNYD